MKIDKLYTLSQFVDLMENSTVAEMVEFLGVKYHTLIPITIFRYNNFLKQPLKKDMFVNELKEPSRYQQFKHGKFLLLSKENLSICHEFEEAEKKVIFDIAFSDDSNCLIVNKNQSIIKFVEGISNKKIGYLAENTDGNLNLKNIEI